MSSLFGNLLSTFEKYWYRGENEKIRTAIKDGHIAKIMDIIKSHKNIQMGVSALCCAVKNNKTLVIENILCYMTDSGSIEQVAQRKHSNSEDLPLHLASMEGNNDIVSILCTAGFNVNAVDEHKRTPLWNAVAHGHGDIFSFLLSRKGIDVNTVTSHTEPEIINRRITVLMKAVMLNKTRAVMEILKHRPDVNVVDYKRRTPLHYACLHGNVECVGTLISSTANINVLDQDHISPLYVACKHGHVDVVNLLLKSGAEINNIFDGQLRHEYTVNCTGNNECVEPPFSTHYPLIAAIENRHSNIVSLLCTNGADVNIRLFDERTPLHIACSEGTVEITRMLVDHGADVNAEDSFNQIPLFYCLRSGKLQMGIRLYSKNQNTDIFEENTVKSFLSNIQEGNKIFTYLLQKGTRLDCYSNNEHSMTNNSCRICEVLSAFILLTNSVSANSGSHMIGFENSTCDIRNLEFFHIHFMHLKPFKILPPSFGEQTNSTINIRNFNETTLSFVNDLRNPLSLKKLCRLEIRKNIITTTGVQFENSINTLALPLILKLFVMFKS